MAWNIKGRAIEHCNCNSICPCFTSALTRPGDYERCQGFIALDIEEGASDAGDLSGRTVIFLQDAPPMMAEGNWRVGVIVDEGASDEQAELLRAIAVGEAGGPFAAFAPLIGEFLGVERAPISIEHGKNTHTIRVGQLIDAEFKDEIHEGASAPVQLMNTTGVPFGPPVTVSPPVRSKIAAFGMEFDNSGRHGTTSTFDWSS